MTVAMNYLKHNKKRNIGLLNEFFSQHIALCVIEKKYDELEKSKSLWQKYVLNESLNNELIKEHQVFNVLFSTKVENKEIAYSLMNNLKKIVVKQNIKELNDQKTRMIHEVNNLVKDEKFFEREVKDYRTMAIVQTLINSWREITTNPTNVDTIKLVAHLEEQVINHMTTKKPTMIEAKEDTSNAVLDYGDEEIGGLILNIMNEKFNKTYGDTLTEEQKKILNLYLFSSDPSLSSLDNKTSNDFIVFLESIKTDAINLLHKECIANHNNKLLTEKYTNLTNILSSKPYNNLSINSLNDEMITFFMTISKLKEELMTQEVAPEPNINITTK